MVGCGCDNAFTLHQGNIQVDRLSLSNFGSFKSRAETEGSYKGPSEKRLSIAHPCTLIERSTFMEGNLLIRLTLATSSDGKRETYSRITRLVVPA